METMKQDERRQKQRFPLKLPLNLTWHEGQGAQQAEGTVEDISSTGVYFYLPQSLDKEGKVEFYVRLQSENSQEPGVSLHCLGSIIRVDPNAGQSEAGEMVGVAVHIDRYRFLRPEEKMPGATAAKKPLPE